MQNPLFKQSQLLTMTWKLLFQEANNLAMLKDCLSRCSANSQNMLGILTSFESRLQRLESTIVPVYNETENLRRRQESILYLPSDLLALKLTYFNN